VRTVIMEDCHLTVREIAHEAGISWGSANTILTEVATKFVTKLLSPEQQQLRLQVV
jgi:hypothetical protein